MKGLELSRRYFEEVGDKVFREKFPELYNRMAFGLSGQGSDCLGLDDEYSRDHDFGPGFCIWLTDSDFEKYGAEVQKVYDELPGEFMGFNRKSKPMNPGRVGVMRTSDFYSYFIGSAGVPESLMKWNRIQEHFMASCTSGEVFKDELGEFSAIRNALLPCYPEDIRKKKLAARAASMAQSAQYNFPRMMRRDDIFGARLALGEFLTAALSMMYLLNFKYEPFYKWQFEGAKSLSVMSDALPHMQSIAAGSTKRDDFYYNIECVCAIAARELKKQGLSDAEGIFMEDHGRSIMSKIEDPLIRSLHIMEG